MECTIDSLSCNLYRARVLRDFQGVGLVNTVLQRSAGILDLAVDSRKRCGRVSAGVVLPLSALLPGRSCCSRERLEAADGRLCGLGDPLELFDSLKGSIEAILHDLRVHTVESQRAHGERALGSPGNLGRFGKWVRCHGFSATGEECRGQRGQDEVAHVGGSPGNCVPTKK